MVSRMAAAAAYIVVIGAVTVAGSVAVADTSGEGVDRADRINTSKIEHVVHTQINSERRARGLQPFEYRNSTADTAADHAAWMIDRGQLKHDTDRYTCGPGANIAYSYPSGDVETAWGEIVNHRNNETKIGRYLVKQWMHSPPHREHILSDRYDGHGVGVAVGDVNGSRRVYAADAFCTG